MNAHSILNVSRYAILLVCCVSALIYFYGAIAGWKLNSQFTSGVVRFTEGRVVDYQVNYEKSSDYPTVQSYTPIFEFVDHGGHLQKVAPAFIEIKNKEELELGVTKPVRFLEGDPLVAQINLTEEIRGQPMPARLRSSCSLWELVFITAYRGAWSGFLFREGSIWFR